MSQDTLGMEDDLGTEQKILSKDNETLTEVKKAEEGPSLFHQSAKRRKSVAKKKFSMSYLKRLSYKPYKPKRPSWDKTEDLFAFRDPAIKMLDTFVKDFESPLKEDIDSEFEVEDIEDDIEDISKSDTNRSSKNLTKTESRRMSSAMRNQLFDGDPVRDSKWKGIQCVESSGSESSLTIGGDADEVVDDENEPKKCGECVEMEEEPHDESVNELEDVDSREKLTVVETKVDLDEIAEDLDIGAEAVVEQKKILDVVPHEKCHEKPIVQFSYNHQDGYLQTLGNYNLIIMRIAIITGLYEQYLLKLPFKFASKRRCKNNFTSSWGTIIFKYVK